MKKVVQVNFERGGHTTNCLSSSFLIVEDLREAHHFFDHSGNEPGKKYGIFFESNERVKIPDPLPDPL